MWPFADKSGPEKISQRPNSTAFDRVKHLSSQGMSQGDIVNIMKNEGYSPTDVDMAMRQAMRSGVNSQPPSQYAYQPTYGVHPETNRYDEKQYENLGMPSLQDENYNEPPPISQPQTKDMPIPPFDSRLMNQGMGPPPDQEFSKYPEQDFPIPRLREKQSSQEKKDTKRKSIEEIAEQIVDEKIVNLRDDFYSFKEQVNSLRGKINEIEIKLKQVTDSRRTDLDEIEGKIDQYKESIETVSSKLEGVEEAIRDSLSPMMQSMRSLSDTIKTMKSPRKINSEKV